ncbi:hypothetical protein SAMN05444920_13332 [Nonomuraea solani]|uniref:Uncharacterized protein n=1 Tax=Nonomuraea solani TaxID=1144553 RepID=A0A1H6EYZ6_9ACTN|nr:hypothetical protein SAMN05444920_13332 [Nonomuraea solani]
MQRRHLLVRTMIVMVSLAFGEHPAQMPFTMNQHVVAS